jgi:enoyl-CoA hydratase/carnithine racemase
LENAFMGKYKYFDIERDGRLLIITINRPEVRNCLNCPSCHELSAIWDEFDADPELWLAIITGGGDKAFCAGHDLGDDDPMPATGWAGLSSRLRPISKPMIAAVNGQAYGGGFELALGCDIIIADERAAFAMSEPRVGFVALGGGADRLTMRLPTAVAMGMLLTGRRVEAAEAHRWGIVTAVAPAGKSMEVALQWAEQILLCSPIAVRHTKQLAMAAIEGEEWTAKMGRTRLEILEGLHKLADLKEGVDAFMQKRKPVWQGR